MSADDTFVRPLIKWAGGKQKLLPLLRPHLGEPEVLVEPFFGAGSVGMNVPAGLHLAAESARPLASLHMHTQRYPDALIGALERIGQPFRGRASDPTAPPWRRAYYELRHAYNKELHGIERSAALIALNHAGYNGLYRVNQKGGYNVPIGRKRVVSLPSAEQIRAASAALARTRIWSTAEALLGYVVERPGPRCVIYADPPYLADPACFTAYGTAPFDRSRHEWLDEVLHRCALAGHRVYLSGFASDLCRRVYGRAELVDTWQYTHRISRSGAHSVSEGLWCYSSQF